MPIIEKATKNKKTAFFGGTFDPVHLGHIFLLHEANLFTDYERIIISPVYISNFKQDSKTASVKDRVNMLKIAIAEYKALYPNDKIEIILDTKESEKEEVSYSIDTIKDINKRYSFSGKLGFFIGDDILPTLSKWKSIDELSNMVDFVCFARHFIKDEVDGIKVKRIDSKQFKASSTDIRNGDFTTLSKGVKDYVKSHKLYTT